MTYCTRQKNLVVCKVTFKIISNVLAGPQVIEQHTETYDYELCTPHL
jgi:hypothetical protein